LICAGRSTAEDPVRFFRPPYVRHKERVGVRSDTVVIYFHDVDGPAGDPAAEWR